MGDKHKPVNIVRIQDLEDAAEQVDTILHGDPLKEDSNGLLDKTRDNTKAIVELNKKVDKKLSLFLKAGLAVIALLLTIIMSMPDQASKLVQMLTSMIAGM